LLVSASPAEVASAARDLIEQMRGRDGYIFNLGHGVPPGGNLECIEALVTTLRASS
jgi:uroporphyrinogen-III decarboxylase